MFRFNISTTTTTLQLIKRSSNNILVNKNYYSKSSSASTIINGGSGGIGVDETSFELSNYLKNEQKNENVNIRKISMNTLTSVINGKELLDRGHTREGEQLIIKGFANLKKQVPFASSLFAVPTHALGLASLKNGNFEDSEKLFRLSIDRCDNSVHRSYILPKALNDLGLSLARQKKNDEAMIEFEKASRLALEANIDLSDKYRLTSSILTNKGESLKYSLVEQSKLMHGMAHYQLVVGGRGNDTVDMFRCKMNRAQVFRLSGNVEEGKTFLAEAYNSLRLIEQKGPNEFLRHLPKDKRYIDWAKFLIECGHFHFDESNYELAKQSLQDARDIFQNLSTPLAPDSIINSINMAILERKCPTETSSKEYVLELIKDIDFECELLVDHSYFRSMRPSNFYRILTNFGPQNSFEKAIFNRLVAPLHFPLK